LNAVKIATESAKDRIAALSAEIDRLAAKKFPTRSANRLLDAFRARIGALDQALREWEEEDVTAYDAEQLCLEIQGITSPVLFLHQMLHFLDKVDSPRLPFEMIDAFEDLTAELGVPSKILLKPDRQYNYYTLLTSDIATRRGLTERALAEALPNLVIAGFPSAEADSTLLHTLLFHEIGHVLYRKTLSVEIADLIKVAVTEQGFAATAGDLDCINRWTEEVCCDLIALRLVGSPYWFAFQWYSVPLLERAAAASESHPDLAVRVEMMSDYHRALCMEYREASQIADQFGIADELPRLVRRANTAEPPAGARLAKKMLVDASYRTSVFDIIRRHVRSPFEFNGLAADVSGAAAEITHFIPPGSLLVPEQFRSLTSSQLLALIFGAVWKFRIKSYHEWDKFKVHNKARVLSELTLAAIEASTLVRKFALGQVTGAA
jgi:hypothetical protein